LQHCVVLHLDTKLAGCAKTQTVSHRSLITEAGFNPRLIHVGLLVDKVANNKGFLQVIQFSFTRIISPTIHPSWISYNLDIFPITHTHTLSLSLSSGVARKVTNHNCRSGRGERTWFFLNTSIHVQDSTVPQHTRPHLNIPCHENIKANTLTDIIALNFKHHKMVSITSSSLKGQISCSPMRLWLI
jgi:hypothetical protein